MRQHSLAVAAGLFAVAVGSAAYGGDPAVAVPRAGPAMAAPRALPGPDAPQIKAVAELIARGRPEAEVRERWRTAVAGTSAREADVDRLVQSVLQEAQRMQQADVAATRSKLDRTNEQKARLRQQVETLRGTNQDAERKKWEEQVRSAGDDAQLANVDLQNKLQQQQQTLQAISSISKMLHDTAMDVIHKIGG